MFDGDNRSFQAGRLAILLFALPKPYCLKILVIIDLCTTILPCCSRLNLFVPVSHYILFIYVFIQGALIASKHPVESAGLKDLYFNYLYLSIYLICVFSKEGCMYPKHM